MRRNTPAAEKFGKLLYSYRIDAGLSMRQVAVKIGVPAATVSQVEKAQRAVKEPKLDAWADALGVSRVSLRREWIKLQRENPDSPIMRVRARTITQSTLHQLINDLSGAERERVRGYIEAIIEGRK